MHFGIVTPTNHHSSLFRSFPALRWKMNSEPFQCHPPNPLEKNEVNPVQSLGILYVCIYIYGLTWDSTG